MMATMVALRHRMPQSLVCRLRAARDRDPVRPELAGFEHVADRGPDAVPSITTIDSQCPGRPFSAAMRSAISS